MKYATIAEEIADFRRLVLEATQDPKTLKHWEKAVEGFEKYGVDADSLLEAQGYKKLRKTVEHSTYVVDWYFDEEKYGLMLHMYLEYSDLDIPFGFNGDGEYDEEIDCRDIYIEPQDIKDMGFLEDKLRRMVIADLKELPLKFGLE